jgi:hypothetical protein
MPYVVQEKRPALDIVVQSMARVFKEGGIKADGDLNYVLYAYCKRYIKPSYNNYKNFRGELRECADEIKRRLLDPYEDEKIEENGDVE